VVPLAATRAGHGRRFSSRGPSYTRDVAGDILQKYGTTDQTITLTIASLASTNSRESTVIDNTTNLFSDALVVLKIKTNAAGTSSSGVVYVYAYGTVDNGTTYTDTATGSDAGITQTSPTNLKLIGIINCVANATTYKGGPFSVAQAFGGVLPAKWGIVIENQTAAALDATGGNHSARYQGVYGQYT